MPWKKSTPIEIFKAPLCQRRLGAVGIREPYTGMDDYLLAVSLSEQWSDKTLARLGGIDFNTMDGPALIRRFEQILRYGK